MFMVQSGPIRRSLVAFSTATVAEEEEAAIIFPLLCYLFSFSLSLSLWDLQNRFSIQRPKVQKPKKMKTFQENWSEKHLNDCLEEVQNSETLTQFVKNGTIKNNNNPKKSSLVFSNSVNFSIFSIFLFHFSSLCVS